LYIYEVSLAVDREIRREFLDWLRQHAKDMSELPPIDSASVYESVDEGGGAVILVAHYRMETREAYEEYLRNHAERMRGDGTQRFGGRFTATRRLLRSC
jgi:hypothetical protein